jgi:MbtH protein
MTDHVDARIDEIDESVYRVVRNDEEQYSIWPADRALPPGWLPEGIQGSRSECLRYVEVVWTDMRPASLRRYLESTGRR